LKIIPVIDVLNGVAVHAVRGNRKEYQPLKSVLTASIDPVVVASDFKLQGFSELYLADLDAILGKTPNFNLYTRLAQMGLNLMIDAGAADLTTIKKLQDCGVSKIIIGTETLSTMLFIKKAIQQTGSNNIIVSLDLKEDKILTLPDFDGPTEVFELINTFRNMGVSEFILLDLSRVGSGEGVNIALLQKILTAIDNGHIYVGGGMQSVDDLLKLKELNLLGVLLASALHSGQIRVENLKLTGLF
jgi:phosphoribosylformimino-5-aminoimidazole carboxamide ribotide isomerase